MEKTIEILIKNSPGTTIYVLCYNHYVAGRGLHTLSINNRIQSIYQANLFA